jgi:predicted nucleic acid-binding protein
MPAVLVDSNIFLDVLTNDRTWADWSASQLSKAGDTSRLVINPIVYGEISIRFNRIEDLEDALPRDIIEKEALPFEAAFLAGKIFIEYRKAGGTKSSPLPDFLIGAHAAVLGYQVLTRDPRRFQTHFPKLQLIAIATAAATQPALPKILCAPTAVSRG